MGDKGQSALLGQGTVLDATNQFQKKFKDKSGLQWEDRAATPKAAKYAYVEKSSTPPNSSLD